MRRALTALALCSAAIVAASALSGCYGGIAYESPRAGANRTACGADGCHPEAVDAQSGSPHAELDCVSCHEGTGEEHAGDPEAVIAATDWTLKSCDPCHSGEVASYLYDDNLQVGPFGGSQRKPPQPKAATFPEYKTIVAGHPFTRDYNEEGAHAYMLQDHYETLRGKFETCVQCKSTKVALAFKTGKPLTVAADQEITLTHTATQSVPPKKVKIPKGTEITYKTDPVQRTVDAQAKLPDGTIYTSKPKPSEDATKSNNMIWASTIAAIKDTWPYGAGCNHCHDPHTGSPRLVRQAMIEAIEGTGGVKAQGGTNPYQEGAPKSFTEASAKDKKILSCAQCHVEYVCGKSSVDKVDRDMFGWSKANDLHAVYGTTFGYQQDWKNAIMGQPLIKSQHPETETYWNSPHYAAGASCSDCHMPDIQVGGKQIKSHWFTSPYKYSEPKAYAAFATAMGADASFPANPCVRCHEDRTAKGIAQQRRFFAAQAEVEKLLAQSVRNMGALKATGKDKSEAYATALDKHRQAHAVWENLAVSENSMGFHNFGEEMAMMAQAKRDVLAALAAEKAAAK